MIVTRQQQASPELLEQYREIAPSTLGHFGDQGYWRDIAQIDERDNGLHRFNTSSTREVCNNGDHCGARACGVLVSASGI